MQIRHLLEVTAARAADFLEGLGERPVFPHVGVDELRAALGGPLPEGPVDPLEVVEDLAQAAGRGVVAIPSGRYFGFVIGGAVPAALAADWLTSTWDQNAGLYAAGPSASVVEEVAGGWLKELLGLPQQASVAFVTGCQMAHVTALAAARGEVLRRAGWDIAKGGLFGAPHVRVLVGEHVHVTVTRALRLLGFGESSIVRVAADEGARMRPDALREALAASDGPTIVCAQAGEVNTGAFDPLPEIADAVAGSDAWLHVDGAFGLWAGASPSLRGLVAGVERADSWATDGHKWLNVPYDSGIAFCADADAHRAAMSVHADYLIQAAGDAQRDPVDWTPEFSRRARGFTVYAAIRSLGRAGIAQIVDRCCAHARRFGELLAAEDGVEVLNDVVLNQVLVRFLDEDEATRAVIARVQEEGVAWMSGTTWQGRAAMRISVSNWQTSDADVEATVASILAAVAAARAQVR
jgi:glutamate/tyrosine decarboxylase-like PLP-dependent enzyme